MKKQPSVMGHRAEPPRLTVQGAFLLACVLSIPFVVLIVLDLFVF